MTTSTTAPSVDSLTGIDLEIADHVGVIAINRPAVRNAVDFDTAVSIASALDRLDDDGDVRAIVITGRNGIFCAGMDLKSLAATGKRPLSPTRGAFGIVERPPAKPVIAAVEGAALGGGLEIMLAADLVVAAEDAKLGLPEVTRGLIAAAGGALRLPQRVPSAVAMEMLMTGTPITAQRAFDIGLINAVAPSGTALERATELAVRIAGNAPLAVRTSKALAAAARQWRPEDAFTLQRRYTEPVQHSADAKEGTQAFVEKRRPVWRGE